MKNNRLGIILRYNLTRYFTLLKHFFKNGLKGRILLLISTCLIILPVISLFILQNVGGAHGYETDQEVKSYKSLGWKEKVDDEGYSRFGQGGVTSFDYKIDIYPPNKYFVFKVGTIGKVIMRIRNIEGTLQIPLYIDFDNKHKYPVEESQRIVKGVKNITLKGTATFASILGLNFLSPYQSLAMNVNGSKFNTATIHAPPSSKVVKWGDADYPAGANKISEVSYFFHNFTAPVLVYYTNPYHAIGQILLFLMGLGIAIFIVFNDRLNIHIFNFKSHHMLLGVFLCFGVMVVLAKTFPYPKSIVMIFDDRVKYYPADVKQVNKLGIPTYLWWTLGFTQSIDAMVIGDHSGVGENAPGRNRLFYLTNLSVKKYIILKEFEDTYQAQFFKNLAPNKYIVVPEENVGEELKKFETRGYVYDFLWIYAVKIIVLLSFLILFAGTGWIVLKAFEIRSIVDVVIFITYGTLVFFMLLVMYVIIGWVEHMPIGYHAGNTQGVILTNYFLPGILSGGNLIRTWAGIAGIAFIVLLTRTGIRKINPKYYTLPGLFIFILLVIPSMEYSMKRAILNITSGEADIWDYKLQGELDPFALFRIIRENPLQVPKYIKNLYVYNPNANFSLGISQEREGMYAEAIKTFKKIIDRSDEKQIISRSHFELGIVYKNYLKYATENIEEEDKQYRVLQSAKNFIEFTTNEPDDPLVRVALYELAQLYTENGRYFQGRNVLEAFKSSYPRDELIPFIRFLEAENAQNANQLLEAEGLFNDFIASYPEHALLKLAYTNLADVYSRLFFYNQSIAMYEKAISLYPEPETMPSLFTNLTVQYLDLQRFVRGVYGHSFSEQETIKAKNVDRELKLNLYQVRKDLVRAAAYEANGYYQEAINKYRVIQDNNLGNRFSFYAAVRLAGVYYKEADKLREKYNLGRLDSSALPIINSLFLKSAEEYKNLLNDYGDKVDRHQTLYNLGRSYVEAKEYKKGFVPLLELVNNSTSLPILTKSYADLGDIFDRLDQKKEAIKYYQYYINSSFAESGINVTVLQKLSNIYKNLNDNENERIINNKIRVAAGLLPFQSLSEQSKALSLPVLWTNVELSRGMLSYFLGIIILACISLLPYNIRSIIMSVVTLWVARGLLRIAEQDPFRAIASIWPGFRLSISLVLLIVFILVILLLHHYLNKFRRSLSTPSPYLALPS